MVDGIPFVPLDCHYDDDKIPMIEAEFGLEGFAVIVKLYQKIYGGMGYYCDWNDRAALLFARQAGTDINTLRRIVDAALREDIFDRAMLEKHGILTSHGIQKRFMNVAKRRRQIFSNPEYVLECFVDKIADVNIAEQIADIPDENADIQTTSKVKESEVKESKVNASEAKESKVKETECSSADCAAASSRSSFSSSDSSGSSSDYADYSEVYSDHSAESSAPPAPTIPPITPAYSYHPQPAPVPAAPAENSPPVSAENKRKELEKKYGSAAVDKYEKRFRAWQTNNAIKFSGDMYRTIASWMEQDGVRPSESFPSSFDVDDVMARIRSRYTSGGSDV